MNVATVVRLSGKVTLVTCAGFGLGKAIAFQFAQEGAGVFVANLEFHKAEHVAK